MHMFYFPQEMLKQSKGEEPQLKLNYRQGRDNRASKPQGRQPEPSGIPVNQGLGEPVTLRLYENVLQ